MIGFIGTSVTTTLNHIYYRQYIAITDSHTFHFTVAHALGLSVFTSRLLATDLNTETSTVSVTHTLQILHIIKFFKSHAKSPHDELSVAIFHRELRTLSLSLKN
jgi:hypothetical protein